MFPQPAVCLNENSLDFFRPKEQALFATCRLISSILPAKFPAKSFWHVSILIIADRRSTGEIVTVNYCSRVYFDHR